MGTKPDLEFQPSKDDHQPDYPQSPVLPERERWSRRKTVAVVAGVIGAGMLVGVEWVKRSVWAGGEAHAKRIPPPPIAPPSGNMQPPNIKPAGDSDLGQSKGLAHSRVEKQDSPPRLLRRAPLKPISSHSLPPELRRKKVKVVLKVFVDHLGKPHAIESLFPIPHALYFECVRESVLASRFAPGLKEGKSVSGWCGLTYFLWAK